MAAFTRAAPFQSAGKITPVFTRFWTAAGDRSPTDTARDIRGFAVKFFTDEGNWDLVGNSIPVIFTQGAMKFPDPVEAVQSASYSGIASGTSAPGMPGIDASSAPLAPVVVPSPHHNESVGEGPCATP